MMPSIEMARRLFQGSVSQTRELFDLCDERGRPTGRVKERELVHRDGDWHRAFHCWIVSSAEDQEPHVILQRRAPHKETWGGRWDVSIGGHYAAGEGVEGGLREIREELGLDVDREDLVQVGWRREEVLYESGLIEREVQDIFFLRKDVDIGWLAPDPEEVVAVAFVSPRALPALAEGALISVSARGAEVGPDRTLRAVALRLQAEDLVPRARGYYRKVARFAERLARGESSVKRRRWW